MSAYWKLLPLVAAITLTACGGGGSSGGGVNADAGGGNVETVSYTHLTLPTKA